MTSPYNCGVFNSHKLAIIISGWHALTRISTYKSLLSVNCILYYFLFSRGYDFHRGVDIPTPLYSNVYAIADGTVRIAGSHEEYMDGIVQV